MFHLAAAKYDPIFLHFQTKRLKEYRELSINAKESLQMKKDLELKAFIKTLKIKKLKHENEFEPHSIKVAENYVFELMSKYLKQIKDRESLIS